MSDPTTEELVERVRLYLPLDSRHPAHAALDSIAAALKDAQRGVDELQDYRERDWDGTTVQLENRRDEAEARAEAAEQERDEDYILRSYHADITARLEARVQKTEVERDEALQAEDVAERYREAAERERDDAYAVADSLERMTAKEISTKMFSRVQELDAVLREYADLDTWDAVKSSESRSAWRKLKGHPTPWVDARAALEPRADV